MRLLGRLRGCEDGKLILARDLKENLAKTDHAEKMILSNIDMFIQRAGLDAPAEEIPVLSDGYAAPEPETLDLQAEKIGTIIWASGYQYTCSIVPMQVLDEYGITLTRRCESGYPGLYFLGIPFVPKLKSGLLMGIAEDAGQLAEQIARQG